MSTAPDTSRPEQRESTPAVAPPPLGSWSRVYAAAAGLAVVVLLLLWWFTATYNIPLPKK